MPFIISVLFVLLMFLAGVARADITSLRITDDPANQGRPDVAGDFVVWKDYRFGSWDIFQYDLAHGAESTVIQHPAYQNLPATNGRIVVWQDDRAGIDDNDLYQRSVSGGSEQFLTGGPGNQGLPAISGDRVAYVDDHAGNNDIYVINAGTLAVTQVCTNTASQWQPRISGDKVVWEDNRDGNWNIYMYDLGTGIEEPVTADPGDDRVADISGGKVVWQHLSGNRYDIWMKDLDTGVTSAVTDDAAYQNSPRISGDLIVWEDYDYSRANYDVYMKDLTSGAISPVASTMAIEGRPAVDGETVVWESTVSGSYDVWMAKVLDTDAPTIEGMTPAGATAACAAPLIEARYKDNRMGVDAGSVHLTVDGGDVTGAAQIDENHVSYQPAQLADGAHHVELTVADRVGNSRTAAWDFTTASPGARLDAERIWWASYDDFIAGDLSIRLRLTNTSQTAVAASDLLASPATQGVLMTTGTPAPFGPIAPGSSAAQVIKYHIPPGVSSFQTVVYVSLADGCGPVFYFPGPPPGW